MRNNNKDLNIKNHTYCFFDDKKSMKEKIKKYEDLRIKIRDLTRSVTKRSDDYNEKYIKIKFYLWLY